MKTPQIGNFMFWRCNCSLCDCDNDVRNEGEICPECDTEVHRILGGAYGEPANIENIQDRLIEASRLIKWIGDNSTDTIIQEAVREYESANNN